MSATGLEVFDKTLQSTNTWLNEIGEEQGIGPDKQRAYHALRAVLWTLRDRLTPEEAFHLSAQLPMLVRGIYWDGYRLSGKPEKERSREEFFTLIAERTDQASPMSPEACARAVFGVLARHLPEGEVEDVKQMLPEALRTLFPEA